jgi:hypothetical protein
MANVRPIRERPDPVGNEVKSLVRSANDHRFFAGDLITVNPVRAQAHALLAIAQELAIARLSK